MGHAYTPGLRVTPCATLRRERRLPLKGTVLVEAGAAVEAHTVVARTELPGNVQTLNAAQTLGLDPARVPQALVRGVGEAVAAGDVIASGKSLFGLVSNAVKAPAAGTIESVSSVTGQVILREPPMPVEVNAFVRGTVAAILEGDGVVIETRAAFLQGIFGVGGEAWGAIRIATAGPGDELTPQSLRDDDRGKVIVGGSFVSYDALQRARAVGAAAVVVGGFDDRDLRQLLGRDLGVAITGQEEIGLTLVLTEGFGQIRMADRAWELLSGLAGRPASVSGATQIRAGVLRPEILIPRDDLAPVEADDAAAGLEVGSLLRVIRDPHFGRIGRVIELPAELQVLDTEARVRVLVVEFGDGGERAVIPRANVELIAR